MEVASHRACTHCRTLKTRCLLDETNPSVCERCVRFGRQCIFAPIQKRRPRRGTNARVAELEKEMSALRAMVKPADASSVAPNPHSAAVLDLVPQTHWRQMQVQEANISAIDRTTVASHDRTDPVTHGLLSMETARCLVEQYKSDMYLNYPIVYLAPDCTADTLRQAKPMLFLAILAAAAGKEHHDLAIKLDRMALEEYANRTVLSSEKSLELVQALLVSSTWYQPPTRLNQFKYSEYIHMAEVMVKDIGIASRPLKISPVSDSNFDTQSKISTVGNGDTTSIEARRTYLAVLVKSMGIMITSRRATTMRVTSYAKDCLQYMGQSSESTLGDHILTTWTHLLVIAEEIGTAFNYDDPGAVASIFDVKTQLMMTAFRRRLGEWRLGSAEFDSSPTLQMTYYTVRLYLSEVALHVDHLPEDFNVPYRMSHASYSNSSEEVIPAKATVDALAELVENSHALLDTFMSIGTNLARALPLGMFVRVSYAAFVLAKLCASAAQERSQLAPLIDLASLQAESYLNRTLLFVRNSIGVNGCRLPAIFLNLLSQMREWCLHPELIGQPTLPAEMGKAVHSWLNGNSSVDGTSSSASASPHTPFSGVISRPLALTGSYEDNYEKFGNDKAVRSTAVHGRVDERVDISDTIAQLDTVLSLSHSSSGDKDRPASNLFNKKLQETMATEVQTLDARPPVSLADDVGEMWYHDPMSMLNSANDLLDFEMASLNGVDDFSISSV
ncbi:hypothetical protein NQ176_g702 [Zarea fungicola]|uniref:Uncharacterized protein n=1 Tax=Zarea fungicola TaxID=93591 RepID=A0ACC1NWY0_9HYPO|nr:hypothetical protein NQ176_g702 [Lecanicillium fungicola]